MQALILRSLYILGECGTSAIAEFLTIIFYFYSRIKMTDIGNNSVYFNSSLQCVSRIHVITNLHYIVILYSQDTLKGIRLQNNP